MLQRGQNGALLEESCLSQIRLGLFLLNATLTDKRNGPAKLIIDGRADGRTGGWQDRQLDTHTHIHTHT